MSDNEDYEGLMNEDYGELMNNFADIEEYEKNKDICICDKSSELHYAIVNQVLPMNNQWIPCVKNYSCLHCHNKLRAGARAEREAESEDEDEDED